METLVFEVVRVRVPGIDGLLTSRVGVSEVFQGLIGNTQSGKSAANGFEFGHDLEHLHKLYRARLPDKSTPARYEVNQPRQGKPLKCFSKWRSGYAKLLGQFDFVQTVTVRKCSVKDQLFQILSDGIGKSLVHDVLFYSRSDENSRNQFLYTKILT